MDTSTYTYKGKLWRRCTTPLDKDSFFHSAFGVKTDEDGTYFDKQAKFRRMRWATFLTYFENQKMPSCLADILQKCLSVNDKYKNTSVDDKQGFAGYIFDVMLGEQAVTKEEITVLATLENVKVAVLSEGSSDPIKVIEPNQNIIGRCPREVPKETPKEVVVCLDGNVFVRLESLTTECSLTSDKYKVTTRTNSSKYRKGGSAGSKGVEYQVSLLALVILNAFRNTLSGWRLSTENEEAGKFDDIVLEWSEGTVLIQTKHRENNKKRISLEELTSTNSKNDYFSLPKYFLSYMLIKEKFRVENVIICTNAHVQEGALEFLLRQETQPGSLLYYENSNASFYTLNDTFFPSLKEKTIQYYQQNFKNKGIEKSIITEENLKHFSNHLQIYFNYLPLKSLEKVIEKLLTLTKSCTNCNGKITSSEVFSKVMDWFQQKEGVYFTDLRAKAMFAEIWRDKYCRKLEEYKISLQRNDWNFQNPEQIFHVIPKSRGLLEAIKVYLTLHDTKTNILFVNQEDDIEVQKQIVEAFQLPQYVFLIIIWPTKAEEAALETYGGLKEVLETYKHKKIILVAKDTKLVQQIGFNHTVHMDASMTFEDLTSVVQKRLVKEKCVVFQGKSVSLEELCTAKATEDYGAVMDTELFEKLIKREEIKVGAPPSDLDELTRRYYINRTFTRTCIGRSNKDLLFLDETTRHDKIWNEEIFLEDSIFDVDQKLIFISDGAGMGKSTVLVNLASTVKAKHPHLWVITIALNDYTKVLGESLENRKKTLHIKELLDSKKETKLTNHLEKCVFSQNRKVVLMLDGIDEISPDYTELVFSMVKECQMEPNFAKIFITSRPHISKELETGLKVHPFILKPFTKQNQIDFMTNYWAYNLELKDEASEEKHKRYAEQVVGIISWTNLGNIYEDNDESRFASIPLHLRMAAEIYLDMIGEEIEPNLTRKINVTELYELFVEKKWDIFYKKENPDRKTWANQQLTRQQDKCLVYYRSIALELTVDKDKLHNFLNYQRIDEHVEISLLKIGIVQKLNDKINFIHNTFADYFLAGSLINELQQNQTVEFQMFLIDTIFLVPQRNITRIFFDNLLKKVVDVLPSNIFEKYQSVKQTSTLLSNKSKLLHILAEDGCTAILELILKCVDFYGTDSSAEGNTLHILKHLIGQFGINIKNEISQTPLHRAALRGRTDVVKFLAAKGTHSVPVNVRMKDRDGYTALHLAALFGHLDTIKFLLEYGLDVNDTDFHNRTPLHLASSYGYLDTVKFLLQVGVDPNVRNKSGNTALHSAASFGEVRVVRFLIEHGFDINDKGFRGRTPLHLASAEGYLETIKFLLLAGADFQLRENDGYTALHVAASCGQTEVVKFLVEYGLDLNATDNKGRTMLHLAAGSSRLETVKFLLEIGVDTQIRNENSNTALHCAASSGTFDVVKCLVGHGLDLNDKGFLGRTPLHLASAEGHVEIIKFLLGVGADFRIRDDEGCTLLEVAASSKKKFTVQVIEKYGLDFDGAGTNQ